MTRDTRWIVALLFVAILALALGRNWDAVSSGVAHFWKQASASSSGATGKEKVWDRDFPGPAFTVLILFVVSGMVGGTLAGTSLSDIKALMTPPANAQAYSWEWWKVRDYCFGLGLSSAGGIGGAMAALFVMLIDSKITFQLDNLKVLTYVTTGVISGFLGYQLIGTIARRWADTIGLKEAADKVKQNADQVAEATDQLRKLGSRLELAEARSEGLAAQFESSPEDVVEQAITKLDKVLKEFPDDRQANMILSVLYFGRRKDPQRAAEVLTVAINRGKQAPTDEADMRYNRAAYYAHLLSAAPENEKAGWRDKAVDDIRRSIDLKRSNAAAIAADKDFWPLWDNADFCTLTGRAPQPAVRPGPPAAAANNPVGGPNAPGGGGNPAGGDPKPGGGGGGGGCDGGYARQGNL